METPPLMEEIEETREEWEEIFENDEIDEHERAFLRGYNDTVSEDFEMGA